MMVSNGWLTNAIFNVRLFQTKQFATLLL